LRHLPRRPFVSHGYADSAAVDMLLSSLPKAVEPLRFPPIDVLPNAKVSNALISAILDCDGLIYLKGGQSALSPWVAFERDFALRNKKKVYSFDPSTARLARDTAKPIEPLLYIINHEDDKERVFDDLVDFTVKERGFSNSNIIQTLTSVYDGAQMASDIVDVANRGGYVLVFWSEHVLPDDKWMRFADEDKWPHFLFRRKAAGAYGLLMKVGLERDRCIIAQLDASEVEPIFDANLHVKLFDHDGLSWENHIDGLIVKLYWLMYQNKLLPQPVRTPDIPRCGRDG
jgi:hypothetical protein